MRGKARIRDIAKAHVTGRPRMSSGARIGGVFSIECFGPDGKLKWAEEAPNIVVNVGLDHVLDVELSGATQITTWYVGLIDGASPTLAAADTMASHAGWTENQNYTEANRVTWSDGGVSAQSVDNSASPASFAIDTNSQTIGGAFLVSDNTKGGTAGTLYAEGTFSGGSKSADNGDTLQVTYTFTAADDGV